MPDTIDTSVCDRRPNLPPPPNIAITPVGDPWPRPYYLENGLRRVAPYHYTYNTFCKARWRDREILDIFAKEFRDRSEAYYREAIEEGRIVLNGVSCRDVHTRVKNGDVISHTLHRHEPPVSAQPIRVVHEDEGMIVIDKPAGIPVHPAGRYKFNSIVEIMRAERDYAFNPLPCNRLDRLTSGIMFVGKTAKEAENISQKLRGRTVRKEYVARVKGRFPDGAGWDGDEQRGGVVKCEEPILQISPILGLNRARASGKTAKTLFRRIAYYSPRAIQNGATGDKTADMAAQPPAGIEDDGYSIVHCLPLTGRTHQIRVHLQFLGHPISNDPIYSNRRVFGASLAKGDNSGDHDDEIKQRLSKMGKTELADAYAYSKSSTGDNHTAAVEPTNEDIDVNMTALGLNSETQQITRAELELLRAQELHRKYGPTADYKPLHHGTRHASSSLGELGPSAAADTALPNGLTDENDPAYLALLESHDEMVQDYNKRKGEKLTGEICSVCQTPLYSDPGPQELGIYLHALAYADVNGEWRYTSPMPAWTVDPTQTTTNTSPPNTVPASPAWDYTSLGDEDKIDVEAETEDAETKNRTAEIINRGLDMDGLEGERGNKTKDKHVSKKERKKLKAKMRTEGKIESEGEGGTRGEVELEAADFAEV